MKRNSAWVGAIIIHSFLCFVCLFTAFSVGANIGGVILIIFFVLYANKTHNIISHGPAYYETYIVPKQDIEQHVYDNMIVLSNGKGTANVFYDSIQDIASLSEVNVNLYFDRQKQQHSWSFDPYTQLIEMRRSRE